MPAKEFIQCMDEASKRLLSNDARGHLGASQIGSKCKRKSWYSFRWFLDPNFEGRMLRLFDRGHDEEHRIVRWLRAMGCEIQDYRDRLVHHEKTDSYVLLEWDEDVESSLKDVSRDPFHIKRAAARGDSPRQWGFLSAKGHFAGSCDGQVSGIEKWFPQCTEKGLLECKTSNDKLFKDLQSKGVAASKPEHYIQMQVYMLGLGLPWAIYFSVNKNDDNIYVEVLQHREEISLPAFETAEKIVDAKTAPVRLTNDPSWFECRYCDFREICHYDKVPKKNCRTCVFSEAVEDANWQCNYHRGIIPVDFQRNGCDQWEPIL